MASGFGITGTITGLKETQAALKSLPGKLQRRILRPAMDRATKPLYMTARKNAAKDSGLLRKSITRKSVVYKSGTIVVVIGPDTKHRKEVVRKGSYSKKPQIANPAKYAHLVEFGTRPHSLAKDDTLQRTGPQEQQRQLRAVANIRRWGQMLADPKTTAKSAEYLQKRIAKTKRYRTLAKQERQSKGAQVHPGAAAKPFLRPAFDSTRAQVQSIFADEVRKNIDKLAAKMGVTV